MTNPDPQRNPRTCVDDHPCLFGIPASTIEQLGEKVHIEFNEIDGATICGETLRPISDQEWTCVGRPAHDGDHLALDGTNW